MKEGRRTMNAEALEQLETKIAFLEHANAELSDVVTRQQRDIDALRDQMAALAARIQALRESDATPRTAEDERPPHY
jgi:SlyX protein